MTTIGIVGGLGPESTIDYYRSLVSRYRQLVPDHTYPSIVINSVDVDLVLTGIRNGDLQTIADYLVQAVAVLQRAGAAFGLIAANTPHVVFDDVSRRSAIPLISIVQSACAAAKAAGLKRLGLLGTRFTMEGTFYPDVFARAGIALVAPDPHERVFIHEKYVGELLNGTFLTETRDALLGIVDRMRAEEGVDGLVLAGTELPLLLRRASHNNVLFLDTTQIHVDHAIAELVRRRASA